MEEIDDNLEIGPGVSNFFDHDTQLLQQQKRVGGSGYLVEIEVEEDNEYYGPLFIGSTFEYAHMVYDTTSTWTSVIIQGARGAKMTSDYNPARSTT